MVERHNIKAGEAWFSISVDNNQAYSEIEKFDNKVRALEKSISLKPIKLKVKAAGFELLQDKLKQTSELISKLKKKCDDFFKTKLEYYGKRFIAFGGSLLGLGYIFSDFGDKIEKMGKRTGMSADYLSRMKHVSDLCGTSLEQFENTIKGMQNAIYQASSGNQELARSFTRLGIDIETLKSLSPEQQFDEIRNALSLIPDPYGTSLTTGQSSRNAKTCYVTSRGDALFCISSVDNPQSFPWSVEYPFSSTGNPDWTRRITKVSVAALPCPGLAP